MSLLIEKLVEIICYETASYHKLTLKILCDYNCIIDGKCTFRLKINGFRHRSEPIYTVGNSLSGEKQ